ncbi:hypothetical protein MSP8886_03155 [Marinomonas spartinae]|uniref:Uncharacterized protein n=1 Tax=Marinomonas spartinae TaxID=1792290 RepID=A0A1A8TNF1_9GAMM|nr:hypothetical protein [Marinomonas spartinae]SBS34737.1 hypothetical protein MSP8886_03155 [Marinomonas spartinae]
MLSVFVDRFYRQLQILSDARVSPFSSHGYYALCRQQLTKEYWLVNQKNRTDGKEADGVSALDFGELSELLVSNLDESILSDAAAFLINEMGDEQKAEYINALYFSEKLQGLFKGVVDITGSHHLLSDAVSDKELRLSKLMGMTNNEESIHELYDCFPWLNRSEQHSSDAILRMFTDLVEEGLLDTKVMSLFLLVLTPSQLNVIGNVASNVLSAEDALCVLVRGGMVKHAPLINSVLAQSETPSILLRALRNLLGSSLDNLVEFDVQLAAWQGEQSAIKRFQQEFALNWPKYEDDFANQRVISGYPLVSKFNGASKRAVSFSNLLLIDLFTAQQSLQPVEETLGAA